jgi:PBP4 family serine-type D-alanyl-D-alanine carboxypeptidase
MRYARATLVVAMTLLPLGSFAREKRSASLQESIDRILDRAAFSAAFWGIEVRDLRTDRVLYARNAGKSMTPASTMKLLTTAGALDALGPETRVRTTLETTATLDAAGRLGGDLYLVGRGDSELSEHAPDGRTGFDVLVDALWAVGVRRIDGRLVGHEGLFKGDRRAAGWEWEDLVWCYGPEISALSWQRNCAQLIVSAGARAGDPALVTRWPFSAHYEVRSSVTTSATGQERDLSLSRDLGSNVIRLSGTFPADGGQQDLSVALEDPARYAATVFSEALAAKGIVVSRVATSSELVPFDARVLAAHEGPPLAEVLKRTNKPSDNLRAEMLLRLVGLAARGEASAAAGTDAIIAFLVRNGVDVAGIALVDGSGLAPTSLLTPRQVVDLLAAMDRHPQAQPFRDSLPVAGVDGSLENRMRGTKAERRIVAKTGTRRHINALAGYATTIDGRRLAFSIVVDHHTAPPREATAAIDEICELLVTLS